MRPFVYGIITNNSRILLALNVSQHHDAILYRATSANHQFDLDTVKPVSAGSHTSTLSEGTYDI